MHILRYDTADSIVAVAISADGRVLAGTSGSEVVLWNSILDEPTVLPRKKLGHGQPLCVTFTPEGDPLVVFDNGRIGVYSTPIGISTEVRPLHWYALHPTQPLIAFASGAAVHVWDIVSRKRRFEDHIGTKLWGGLAFDETRQALVGCANGRFEFWSYATGDKLGLSIATSQTLPNAISCSPNGRWLAATTEKRVRVWEIETQTLVKEFPVKGQKQFATLAFHPNGNLIATGSRGLVQQWDQHTWSEVSAHSWRIGATRTMAISPDGTIAAVGGQLGYVAVWDIA
jgi:WD40 repeat protein